MSFDQRHAMRFNDRYESGSLLGSTSIMTRVATETTSCLRLCRVCARPIALGEERRYRPSFHEYAHVACGWFRPDERGIHERRRPGSDMSIHEWRCPSCLLDACDFREPLSIELRCRRCRMRSGPIEEGDVVRVTVLHEAHIPRLGYQRIGDTWDRGVAILVDKRDVMVCMREGPHRGRAFWSPALTLVRA